MWYGKIAIIMTIFSLSLSWGLYEISTLYNLSSTNFSWTYQHIHDLAGNYSSISNFNSGQTPNINLLFGDFSLGLNVMLNAIAIAGNSFLGGGLASVLQGIPGIDANITLVIQIIYGSSEIFLWIYVVANRSL